LETDDREISDLAGLRQHIEGYYKNLFGKQERENIRLQEDIWESKGALSEWEVEILIEPFTKKEFKEALGEMKSNSAPSPDGLTTEFYKFFWQ
jgi:hypothetical protein